jgi:Archaeal/vacuolar-type H+-ATPase subunit I
MKKLTAVVPAADSERLTRVLEKLSCVELCKVLSDDSEPSLPPDRNTGSDAGEARREVMRLESVIKKLTPYRAGKPALFPPPEKLSFGELYKPDRRFDEAIAAADESDKLFVRLTELKNETARLEAAITALEPWKSYDLPLGFDNTRQTHLIYGTFPITADIGAVEARLERDIEGFYLERVSSDENVIYTVVIYHNDDDVDMPALLSQNGFVKLELAGYDDTAVQKIAALGGELSRAKTETETVISKLSDMADKLPALKRACDVLRSRASRAEAKQNYLRTRDTVIISGWLPVRAVDAVKTELEKLDCAYSVDEPAPGETPPSLLLNNKALSPFEMVLGMYSLPAYGAFDPTLIMSIFYFLIFGLMLNDFVYGLLLTVGGFLAMKFLHLARGTRRLVGLFAICGISCMVSGILFGGYLGDFPVVFAKNMLGITMPSPALWFDPVSDPISFLILSLVVGFIHLIVGMGIKFYVLCATGHPFAAIFDIGSWYVVYAGIGLYFLNPTIGAVVAIAGAAMLVLSQGREEKNIVMKLLKGILSLYGFVNFVADLLSYSRIMALGMASAVIASVINIISTLNGPSVIGYLVMIVIIVLGNVINLAINLLGSFVHTSRLQYIEFFGKFYEDGGIPFTPLTPELEYSEITE